MPAPRPKNIVNPGYYRRQVAVGVAEAELLGWVVDLARGLGWQARHIRQARGQALAGLPDLLLWHEGKGQLLWAELKKEDGKLSKDRLTRSGTLVEGQEETIASLRQAGQTVYVWRPSDWLSGEIEEALG